MHPPKVFVSATSGDLRGSRQVVKDALLTIGCLPVEQTNFPPDYRTLVEMLRGRIGECQALIHLVGLRYGAEPDPANLPEGTLRRSYTQLEYHLARDLGLRVYTFLLPENYPYDQPPDRDGRPAQPESEDKVALQAEHRAALRRTGHLYESPADRMDLRTRVTALQEQVKELEQEHQGTIKAVGSLHRWGFWGLALILAVGLAGLALQHISDKGLEQKVEQTAASNTEIILQAIAAGQAQGGERSTPEERYRRGLEEVAFHHRIAPAELSARLDQWSAQVQADPQADPMDQALAAYHIRHYAQAATQAAQAYEAAMARRQQDTQAAIQAAQLEGDAQYAQGHWAPALAAYRKAASLIDRGIDPFAWADAQRRVAEILRLQSRFDEAEGLLEEVVAIRQKQLGDQAPELAVALFELALVYDDNFWRFGQAEPLCRRAIEILEAHYGPDHPQVAAALNKLAQVIWSRDPAKAEAYYRRALRIDEASYGPDHPDVARDLNNLAWMLSNTDRPTESERLYRRALNIDEASLGPENPVVGTTLHNLAKLLRETNRLAEAEPFSRRALKVFEGYFGPDHQLVANELLELAKLLLDTNRPAEAEPLCRRALKAYETSYGPNNPVAADALAKLADALRAMNRPAEAEPLIRRSLKVHEAAGGADDFAVAADLNNLAILLDAMNRPAEAEPLSRRAVEIVLRRQTQQIGLPSHATLAMTETYLVVARHFDLGDDEAHRRLDQARQDAGLDPAAFESLWQDVLDKRDGPFDVAVVEVIPGGQGEALGLKAGDVLLSYGGEPLTNIDQLIARTGTATDEAVSLEVLRDGEQLHLTASPGRLGVRIENRPRP